MVSWVIFDRGMGDNLVKGKYGSEKIVYGI